MLDALVWQKVVMLLTDPREIKAQFERWKQSDIKVSTKDYSSELRELTAKEERFANMYGDGYMQADIYKAKIDEINKRRSEIASAQNEEQTDTESPSIHTIDPERIVKLFTEKLSNLQFTDRLFVVRQVIDKIVATQEGVTIWGHIPVPVTANGSVSKVGLRAKHRYSRITQCR